MGTNRGPELHDNVLMNVVAPEVLYMSLRQVYVHDLLDEDSTCDYSS